MQLGVNVPNFGPATSVDLLERWAHVAEGLGFDLLMMSDHVLVTEDVAKTYPGPFHDPFTTLAWLAGRTSAIRLGTTVLIMPYRQPALTAQMAASLHRLSGGRFVLGVGVGWARKEFEALEIPFGRRGALTDEYLDEMHQIWGGGVEGVAPALAPGELPGPPVWIGGNSDAAIRRAVVSGQGWHPLGFTTDWFEDAVPRLKSFADEAGRAVPTVAPRIKLRLTAEPVTDPDRPAGRNRHPGPGPGRPGPAAGAGFGDRGAGHLPRRPGGAGAARGGFPADGRGRRGVGPDIRATALGVS